MKRIVVFIALLATTLVATAQTDWKKVEKLIEDGSYKTAFAQSERVFNKTKKSNELLSAAWYMMKAAMHYQEDPADSAEARFRAILPRLEAPERAVCYAMLGEKDSALMDEELLKRTPADRVKRFCTGEDGEGVDLTPTVYDVVVMTMMMHEDENRVALLEKLIEFHKGDSDDIRILLDLAMIELRKQGMGTKEVEELYKFYINKYRASMCKRKTQFYCGMANRLNDNRRQEEALRYCDSAIALAPGSQGAMEAHQLKDRIEQKIILIDSYSANAEAIPGRPSLHTLIYRNVGHLYFGIAPYEEDEHGSIKTPKVFRRWEMAVDTSDKYNNRSILFDVPALEAGRWMLVVSADDVFDKNDALLEIKCTDLKVLRMGEGVYQLVHAVTGEPIRGQEVVFFRKDGREEQILSSVLSDIDGRVSFEGENGYYWIKIVRNGYVLSEQFWKFISNKEPQTERETMVFRDRPIYRPGDTVHVTMMHYETDGYNGRTLGGRMVTFVLYDPNDEERDSVKAITDEFGVASAMFIIPRDALAGGWNIILENDGYNFGRNGYLYIEVEEYKQPKFMVSLDASSTQSPDGSADQPLALGKPYTVRGLAQAYSGAKIDGAKVKYTVKRYTRYWRGYYGKCNDITVLDDSTVTAADGSFTITFTPKPDSLSDITHRPYFRFEILAEVTDLNGETHSAQTKVVVGYHNTTLKLAEFSKKDVSSLESVAFSLQDINGRPLAGDVKVTLNRYHFPDTARLLPTIMTQYSELYNTLSRERFRELFPSYVYSLEEYKHFKKTSDWEWSTTEHITADELQHSVKLPPLKSGFYSVVATCGEEVDTQYVVLTLPDEPSVQSRNLIWADIQYNNGAGGECLPGDRITLRYASAFDDVRFFYVLVGPDDKERDTRWLPAGRGIKQLSIYVDSTMLGGFQVNLFAVKDGVPAKWSQQIMVPFAHKELKMDIATFRDKLQPGEQEEWTIKVSEAQKTTQSLGRPAALMMTMFDDALSSYGYGVRFMEYPWRVVNYFYGYYWTEQYGYHSNYRSDLKYHMGRDPEVSFWVVDFMPMYYGSGKYRQLERNMDALESNLSARGEDKMVSMQGGVRKRTGINAKEEVLYELEEESAVVEVGAPEHGARMSAEDIAHMPAPDEDGIVATVGGIGISYSDDSQQEPVQVRSNLSTLAFFVADLRTDATGTATYRFRVPELLTRWRVEGFAVTKDLKIGILDRTLVTQKSLMVQPNIPRFLRHGDSLVLMAKVMNLSDNERQVRVKFTLGESTPNTLNASIIQKEQLVTVPAQGSAQVTFPIANLPRDLYVATYEITAQTCDERGHRNLPNLSDGERGQIPVVSDRQAVTLSQPLFINGKGEKTFHFSLSTFHSSTTAEPHFLAAELTTDPIWLAVKAMPYLKQQENPSNIYLANSLYVNTLANNILENLKGLKDLKSLADTVNTRLKINEDVKQTLLEATPWLRDAEAEVEQRQAIANYFDAAALKSQFSNLNSQLEERQNSDGGWSWMPDGESSLWVTMQILKRLSILEQSGNQAIKRSLAYVDKEEQRYYDKYIKPYLKKGYQWESDNIDYLYTRSFYGKGKTEAYKFYYNNALKNYKKYDNLYTQAQLALIFQRHGDKKTARDIIRRLKENALIGGNRDLAYQDNEMGMYWRDNRSGWCWYERPIETQALLIQAFREVTPSDTTSIALMQQWLLKQKQTTHWGNDRATVEAINALMPQNTQNIQNAQNNPVSLTVLGTPITAVSEGLEGYSSQRWTGDALDTVLAQHSSLITLKKETPGIAWGSVYYQYTDDMDKIPSSESGITLNRSYINLSSPGSQSTLKVGDRLRVRIEISVDRNMEYLELIDGRPSCVEPLSTRAGWNWNSGLRYYVVVKNTATHCYIDRLEKGKYIVEYEVYVTNPGTFLAGPVTMQCMYAPEFRATAPAQRLSVD